MADTLRVLGVDPGPVPGVVLLEVEGGRMTRSEALQCTHGMLYGLLYELVRSLDPNSRALVAVERFVVRGRAIADQRLTLDQVANLQTLHPGAKVRSASEVKPWATDDRLEKAGLLAATKGMRHSRDAARHALFAAVHDGGLPDPLSKDWKY